MAVKIRMRQQGRKNYRTFRLVACDTHVKRDGKYLDILGWYNPHLKEKNSELDEEKLLHWLNLGAEMTEDAKKLIARSAPAVIKHWNEKRQAKKTKITAQKRAARKKASTAK